MNPAPAIAPPGKFSAVSAGTFHTYAVRDDASIVCWGSYNAIILGE